MLQMWLLAFAVLVVGAFSAPVDVSPECAACQLLTIAVKKSLATGKNLKMIPTKRCSDLPECQTSLTECQIVKSLLSAPTTNITSAMRFSFHKMHNHLQNVVHQCEQEPQAKVLADQPGPAICTLCFLIYYFFQFMNNGILQLPLLQLVPDAIELTCLIVMNLNNEITPPVCQALLADGALPALLKAIADSMGSFYNLIAVQAFGCPTYQTLLVFVREYKSSCICISFSFLAHMNLNLSKQFTKDNNT
ncbi:hypothetical protein NECAME_08248 [Necator americanus]|uniref:Surfactant protein B n=1 Tax=Necator americanus TaxID=51031 RepID=W2TK38_NECAM|nr:hypothetical protein NECAME_08248 [Necator americanus]ETN81989.1 hypothetical protein NECAME_08248 [Necator americanus]